MRLTLLALPLAAACADPDPLSPASLEALRLPPVAGGCSDVTLYAANATDTFSIEVSAPGMASDAAAAGGPVTLAVNLPDPSVYVGAELGTDLTSATCVGAYPYPGPQVDSRFDIVSGHLKIRVTPDANATPNQPDGIAEVRLVNATFDDGNGNTLTVARAEWTASVGLTPP